MQLESRERSIVTRGFAILNYGVRTEQLKYPPPEPVLTLPNTTLGYLDYDLRPLNKSHECPSSEEVTRTVTITVHQRVDGQTTWIQDGYNWTEQFPGEPYLVSLYKNDGIEFPSLERALEPGNNGIDPVTRAFPAKIGEVLEIIIQNTGADKGGLDAHPFHAHGAHYWDLGSGNGTYNATENNIRLQSTSPAKRDTTMLYRYALTTGNGTEMGWRAWRLKVTEPGVWMIHCHILQHMLMGMQTIWVMGNSSEVLGRVPTPEVEGYLTYGGDVFGNETHYPNVVHFKDNWEVEQ